MGAPPQPLVSLFEKHFEQRPRWLSIAPGRVNIIGEHTDYNSGLALPMAIDRHVSMVACETDDPLSTVASTNYSRELQLDLTADLQPLPIDHPDAFANYLLGVASEFQALGIELPLLKVLVHSDIPIGAGLASSAAVEVAFAKLLQATVNVDLSNMQLAKLCQRAEHAFTGTPCGLMDQWTSLESESGHALLMDFESEVSQPLALPDENQVSWIVFDTAVKHRLADGQYASRRSTCETVAKTLGESSLRPVTPAMLQQAAADGVIDDVQHRYASHVVLENVRVLLAATALTKDDLATWSEQMFASHDSLRKLYEISCEELDVIVDAIAYFANEYPSLPIAGRMTGGGFGGCVIAGCAPAIKNELVNFVQSIYARRFEVALSFFEVRPSGAATVEPITSSS